MATKHDPFAGKSLLGSAAPSSPPVDQRLFTTEPFADGPHVPREPVGEHTDSPLAEEATKERSLLVGKEGSREIGKEASLEGKRPALFDLSEKPFRKDSFLFTDDEFETLDDAKLDLRRKYDLKATKNDLARCGLGYLLDDYKRRGEESELVRRLRKKTVNR